MMFVLVVSHGDRSGVRQVWGPFDTETSALLASDALRAIDIEGIHEVFPLRSGLLWPQVWEEAPRG